MREVETYSLRLNLFVNTFVKNYIYICISIEKTKLKTKSGFSIRTAKVIHFSRNSNNMKAKVLLFLIIVTINAISQVHDDFSDGNFNLQPSWTGSETNFFVNTLGQLQSKAASTSTSWLFTASESINNASWECWVKINYTTSSTNYASVYIVSDNNDLLNGCNGYYVQIGGTNDEVSLYLQQGVKKTKIIDGLDKRIDGNVVEVRIKVVRDSVGNFELYSKLPSETEFVFEGKTLNNIVTSTSYFGLFYSNSGSTGSAYYFDDVKVSGEKAIDDKAPEWELIKIVPPNSLSIRFTEKMDFSRAVINVDQGMGKPENTILETDGKSATLIFKTNFEKGVLYIIETDGLTDLTGNALLNVIQKTGIPESLETNDIIINEVMFEQPENSVEYVEIYNKSNKIINLKGLTLTTRKTNGELNTGSKILNELLLPPKNYAALCENADSLKNYYQLNEDLYIIQTSWSSLNNETSTILICNEEKDTLLDELSYNVKWHHLLVKNPKGVALERINPELPTQEKESWHSAASEYNFGTPGYRNSQFREIEIDNDNKKIKVEPTAFSPDNDGIDDLCFIQYSLPDNGYVATLLILNSVGVKIYELAVGKLLSTEGFFTWDGKTDRDQIAKSGIYVLFFEAFNPNTGHKIQQKHPIVISNR